MTEKSRFKGKVAIVTGGGSGLGEAMALRFAKEGARVAIPDINLDAAQRVQREIGASGGKALAMKTDVSRAEDVKAMVKQIIEGLGKIDILVNNAGVVARAPLLEIPEEEWDRELAVDLRGVYLCIKYVAPEMIKAGKGKIVNISSVAGLQGFVAPAYTAAKGGVVALTRIMAGELAPHKININSVCPGFCATPMNKALRETEVGEMIRNKIPLGRWGTPKDIAATVCFLASDEADYITGVSLAVDGGLSNFWDIGKAYRTFDQEKAS